MRTAIFFGLVLVAGAINDSFMTDSFFKVFGAVLVAMVAMDVLEFFHNMDSKK